MEARVATIAETYTVKRAAAKAPISAHPAFPAIVALWFAALLGLGSLVLPAPLIERLVTVTGLASLIPSAAPPLGFTARVAISLTGSIVGAIAGLMLARQVAGGAGAEPRARSLSITSAQRRPISAHDELGEEGLGSTASAPSPVVQKRRALTMTDDNSRSEYLQTVPLPGQSAHAEIDPAVPDVAHDATASSEPHAEPEHEPLELGAFAETDDDNEADARAETPPDAGLEALRRRIHTPDLPAMQDQSMTDRQTFRRPAAPDEAFDEDGGECEEFRPIGQPRVPQAFERRPDEPDPLPFAAPSLRRAGPASFDEDEEDDRVEASQDLRAEEPAPQLTVVADEDQPAGDDDRPLGELGLVQLAARLGASLERRRALLARRRSNAPDPRPASTPLGEADDFETAGAEDAARAIADFFGPARAPEAAATRFAPPAPEPASPPPAEPIGRTAAAAIPAAMRGLPLEGDDEHDDADDEAIASFSLPLAAKPAAALRPAEEEDEAEEFDEDGDESEYSSLLAMKNPFVRQQEFVRIEEPEIHGEAIEPTVSFPSAAPAEPAQQQGQAPARRPFDPPKDAAEAVVRQIPGAAPRDRGDAERNLRDALATLQRTSGAG